MGERNDLSRVLRVLKTSKVAEECIKALEDLSKSYSKCSSAKELAILEVLTTCWQEQSSSVLRDCKWRTNICRVGNLRLPVIHRGPQVFTHYVQLATKANTWCATCVSKQAEEMKSKGARQDVLSKAAMAAPVVGEKPESGPDAVITDRSERY